MLTNEELQDISVILNVQQHLVNRLKKSVEVLEQSFSTNEDTALEIESLQQLLDEVLADVDLLSDEDIDFAQKEAKSIDFIYEAKRAEIKSSLEKIAYTTWNDYVAQCYQYSFKQDIDPFLPYEMLLSKKDLETIKSESYANQYKWDKWDYLFVGLAGFIGALIDFFIVAIPKDMNTGVYKGQKGSPLTKWLQELKLPPALQKWLEEAAKVPYDQTGGSLHRIDTPGHDPVLGFVFGVIDLIRGTSTSFKDGNIIIEKVGAGINPLEALIKQFLHLCSDAFTKTGLPVPFASIFKLQDIGSFKRANGKTATVSQLTTWMYYHGYDLRHFVTMSATPASIEIILRLYIMIRQFVEKDDWKFKLANNPKYRLMLLSAHSIACATNVGKVYLRAGNPLAINYAEWLMFIRYLVPSLKYWLFDRAELELNHLEKVNDQIWDELVENSDNLLKKCGLEQMEIVSLG
ncbi:hypothetical protein [Alkalihalobacillus deserti]|uniref:hypothetical protein n=1 Tax=Alkalihalobacillus deserti TaxID=2879466 RepID=UPI001D158E91|nr:hypothetical protein [Alkalihalobacillus deserti]